MASTGINLEINNGQNLSSGKRYDDPEYEYEKKTKKKVSKKRKHIQKIKDYEQLEHDRNAGEHSFYYR